MNRQGQVPDHGTLSRYHGTTGVPACRCTQCRTRATREGTLRTLDRLAGRPRRVPADTARAHILAFRQNNISYDRIARASGYSYNTIRDIALGYRKAISSSIAAGILAIPSGWSSDLDWTAEKSLFAAIGATRRLQALYAIGIPVTTMARESRLSKDSVNRLVSGQWVRLDGARVANIKAAYDRLWAAPGSNALTRQRARREGWAGPLHWNDESIDDPNGFPDWTGACGTPQGYQRHGRDASLPSACKPCKSAWARAKASRAGLAA